MLASGRQPRKDGLRRTITDYLHILEGNLSLCAKEDDNSESWKEFKESEQRGGSD